jgi:hypothetical protein
MYSIKYSYEKEPLILAPVAHVYNPSDLGG